MGLLDEAKVELESYSKHTDIVMYYTKARSKLKGKYYAAKTTACEQAKINDKIAEIEGRINELILGSEEEFMNIAVRIEKLDHPYNAVLRYRYISLLPLPAVGVKTGYSLSQVKRLLSDAEKLYAYKYFVLPKAETMSEKRR